MNPEIESDVETETDPTEPSWSRLVDRIQAGDPAGMEQLYAVFVKGVRFFLWRQLGPQDLDDKVHDVFLIITQSIKRGELREPERLMGYVRTVVRRQVAAHIDNAVHARRNQQSIDPAMTLSDHQPDPERRAIEKENQDVAMRMLAACPNAIARYWFASICRSSPPRKSAAI
jgi:hypothetical protein